MTVIEDAGRSIRNSRRLAIPRAARLAGFGADPLPSTSVVDDMGGAMGIGTVGVVVALGVAWWIFAGGGRGNEDRFGPSGRIGRDWPAIPIIEPPYRRRRKSKRHAMRRRSNTLQGR